MIYQFYIFYHLIFMHIHILLNFNSLIHYLIIITFFIYNIIYVGIIKINFFFYIYN